MIITGGQRNPRDFYPTPEPLVRAALSTIQFTRTLLTAPRILDPGCGDGVWGRVAREFWPDAVITGVDIKPGACEAYDQIIEAPFPEGVKGKFDFIIGNPPYSLAEEFIRDSAKHLERRHGEMMFLLRLNFLASQKRGRGLFRDLKPTDIYVLCQRPSFTGDGRTDDSEYALFSWSQWDAMTLPTFRPCLSWLDWKPARAQATLALTGPHQMVLWEEATC